MLRLGVIGYGMRANGLVTTLQSIEDDVRVVAVTDTRTEKELKEAYKENVQGSQFYTDADQMLRQGKFDGIIVATRCRMHTPMACKVARYRLPMILEKPVGTSEEQLTQLRECLKNGYDEKVVVSFPLRASELLQKVRQLINAGEIGQVAHVIAHNYVPYGGAYYGEWYRNTEETKGQLLQKATHDFDYINYLLARQPVSIAAMSSRQVFGGDKPKGLTCFN